MEPSELSAALALRFPSTFGGLVVTGTGTIDIFAADEMTDLETMARDLAGEHYVVNMRQSEYTLEHINNLKKRIERDRPTLVQSGVPIKGLGIRIEANGPRVLVLLNPNTPEAVAELNRRYGANTITLLTGEFVDQ